MTTLRQTLPANGTLPYTGEADFFALVASTGEVDIRFYRKGSEVHAVEGIDAFFSTVVDGGFDGLRITDASGAPNTIKAVVMLDARAEYAPPPTGNVNVQNTAGAHANSRAVVLSAAVSQLLAANAARRFLLIQNNDAAVALRVTCDGADPTAAQGIRIQAGGSLLLDSYPPTGAIKAIAESGAGIAVEVQAG